jgi:MOSC domain-containing protein YiiM
MTDQAQVVSIHIGGIREFTDAQGRPWHSAIGKESVHSLVFLGMMGLAGDQVSNLKHHGGLHQAVLAYPVENYPFWKAELGLDVAPGAFGENLAVAGLSEEEACIGETFELGEAILRISSPRRPCHTLTKRWDCPGLVEAIWRTARGGWYCRVLREGHVRAGQPFSLIQRPHPGWTVARVFRSVLGTDAEEHTATAALEYLAPRWKEKLEAKD